MALPHRRMVAALFGDGHIRLLDEERPPVENGMVLVEVHASLVSPGTEFGGWHGLVAKWANPETDREPRPFGYSNAGVVLECGAGVSGLSSGDRVACIGGGYALHTDYAVVPQNLCVPLPDKVTFVQGSYAMLAATALHALRRGEPEFGEFAAVVGLGIVGQLTAQLYHLAGNFVIGWDALPSRVEIAERWGIDAALVVGENDAVERTRAFTDGCGLDAAVIAFGGDATEVMRVVEQCMKKSPDGHRMGRAVIVGGAGFEYTAGCTNLDVRRAARTGPGYHDEPWERGAAYPPVLVRWTTHGNIALCLRLIAEGKLNVDVLTTHEVPLVTVDEGISAILEDPDRALGVALVCGE